ncbi:beta-defensin 106 [Molossus molossus]|uniref:beta-defensin 106 n=1 Tax=Molossus molossus TaxID=27622 RepID=UPI001746D5FC|nr:beta-defensin 106 [Molossus molossus]
MRMFLFLFAVFFFLAPARNAFFDKKCYKLKGRCVNSCQKNEELVSLCQKSRKCCLLLQTCSKSKEMMLIDDKVPGSTTEGPATSSPYPTFF